MKHKYTSLDEVERLRKIFVKAHNKEKWQYFFAGIAVASLLIILIRGFLV